MRGRVGTDIKLLPVMSVSLHSKIHPLFMKYSNGTSTQCYASIRARFLCLFYNPFLIQRIFHLLVSTLYLLVFNKNSMLITQSFLANLKLKELMHKVNVHSTLTYCVLLATVLTAVATESSPQNVLTCDLANWVRKLYMV